LLRNHRFSTGVASDVIKEINLHTALMLWNLTHPIPNHARRNQRPVNRRLVHVRTRSRGDSVLLLPIPANLRQTLARQHEIYRILQRLMLHRVRYQPDASAPHRVRHSWTLHPPKWAHSAMMESGLGKVPL